MRTVAEDSAAVAAARRALAIAGSVEPQTWLVGGAVRDVLLGRRVVKDLDLVTAGDARAVGRAVAVELDAPVFALSDRYGGFRVTAAGGMQIDVVPLTGGSIEADLRRRDLTVNALAVDALGVADGWPAVAEAEVLDAGTGRADLRSRTLRSASDEAFTDDPLRVLRAARMVAAGGWRLDGATVCKARAAAADLAGVAGERSGEELRLLLAGERAIEGLRVLGELGGTASLLPELAALDGVQQGPYHHLDVGGHTREVLSFQISLERRLDSYVDDATAAAVEARLDDVIAGEWTVRQTLRLAALMHDIAKPQTRTWYAERGLIGFPNHDREGRKRSGEILKRLRLPRRVIDAVGAMTLHHLRLGYLVHAAPLDRAQIYDYLRACEPVEVEVTVLALADRLVTRGRGAQRAIHQHADLTRTLLPEAVAWRAAGGAPAPLVDGNQLVSRTGREPGPWLAAALEAQRRARFVDPAITERAATEIALDAGAGG